MSEPTIAERARRVICPSCKGPVAHADVNVQELVALCRRCEAVFDFRDQIPPGGQPRLLGSGAAVAQPPRIILRRGRPGSGAPATGGRPEALTIARRWFRW